MTETLTCIHLKYDRWTIQIAMLNIFSFHFHYIFAVHQKAKRKGEEVRILSEQITSQRTKPEQFETISIIKKEDEVKCNRHNTLRIHNVSFKFFRIFFVLFLWNTMFHRSHIKIIIIKTFISVVYLMWYATSTNKWFSLFFIFLVFFVSSFCFGFSTQSTHKPQNDVPLYRRLVNKSYKTFKLITFKTL